MTLKTLDKNVRIESSGVAGEAGNYAYYSLV